MKGWRNISLILRFFMVLIYITLGVVILFVNKLPLPLDSFGRSFLGTILIIYGIFRMYTYYAAFKANSDEE